MQSALEPRAILEKLVLSTSLLPCCCQNRITLQLLLRHCHQTCCFTAGLLPLAGGVLLLEH